MTLDLFRGIIIADEAGNGGKPGQMFGANSEASSMKIISTG